MTFLLCYFSLLSQLHACAANLEAGTVPDVDDHKGFILPFAAMAYEGIEVTVVIQRSGKCINLINL